MPQLIKELCRNECGLRMFVNSEMRGQPFLIINAVIILRQNIGGHNVNVYTTSPAIIIIILLLL